MIMAKQLGVFDLDLKARNEATVSCRSWRPFNITERWNRGGCWLGK